MKRWQCSTCNHIIMTGNLKGTDLCPLDNGILVPARRADDYKKAQFNESTDTPAPVQWLLQEDKTL